MILDLPPETVQAIIAKAEMQGVTPAELLTKDYANDADDLMADQAGIYTDLENGWTLGESDAQRVFDLLENPPPLSATAKAFLEGKRV